MEKSEMKIRDFAIYTKSIRTPVRMNPQRKIKPKTTISGRLENSSGEKIRTSDLRVMSRNRENCTMDQQSG
jgi:hypothetical protein